MKCDVERAHCRILKCDAMNAMRRATATMMDMCMSLTSRSARPQPPGAVVILGASQSSW
jgi:hypothetical protein